MHEITFISQNESYWKRLERILASGESIDSDELGDLYIRLLDDLSYAQTFYPNSKLIAYLNRLASQLHTIIYSNKKEDKSRWITFFTDEVPLAIHACRRSIILSAMIFVLAMGIGFLSAAYDDTFTQLILGERYAHMTIENIEKGDPFGVYRDDDQGAMFLMIGSNNIRVAFVAFIVGIFMAFLTVVVLVLNGIMVGAFAAFFASYDLLGEFFTTVFIHGTLELSAIVIAAGAGMHIGLAFLFPGTYPRLHALVSAARDGLKVMISLIPIFVIAAFLESYVTGTYQTLHDFFKWFIILLSMLYIIFYFMWWPRQLINRTPEEHASNELSLSNLLFRN